MGHEEGIKGEWKIIKRYVEKCKLGVEGCINWV